MTFTLSGVALASASLSPTVLQEIAQRVIVPAAAAACLTTVPIQVRGGAVVSTRHKKKTNSTPPPTSSSTTLASSNNHNPHAWLQTFFLIPAPLRYFISGSCANVVLYFTERCLYHALFHFHFSKRMIPDDWTEFMLPSWVNSATFFSAYMLQVPVQHYLHALLVYGLESINTPAKYSRTLGGMFSTLAVSAVGSTMLNAVLLNSGKLNKNAAFLVTLFSFSLVNYFVIGWIVRLSNHQSRMAVEIAIHNKNRTKMKRKKVL